MNSKRVIKKEKNKIQLSDHFSFKKLIRFALPSICMMIFVSIYAMVDGLCISNFVGEEAFTAVNLVWPWPMLLGAFGFMFGSGGTALVGKILGEGDREKANKYFTSIVLITFGLGALLAILSDIFMKQICLYILGADEETLDFCMMYGYFLCSSIPFFMVQNLFQNFMVVAEKPKLGLIITIIAGCTNIVLDLLFVGLFKWGVPGAAVASVISQVVGATMPIIYFLSKKNNSLLRFTKPQIGFKNILKVMTNGSSELLSNVSVSIVNILYNHQLLKYLGNQGVAAYGVIQYVCFVFMAIFFGFMLGVGPLISFNYGAKNREELRNIFRKSLIIILIAGFVMTCLGEATSRPLALAFVKSNSELCNLTTRGFILFSLGYFFMGFNVMSSATFTSLNNGPISLIISFGRTLVFQIICVYCLPLLFGTDGIWISFLCAEGLSIIVSIFFLLFERKKYGY